MEWLISSRHMKISFKTIFSLIIYQNTPIFFIIVIFDYGNFHVIENKAGLSLVRILGAIV